MKEIDITLKRLKEIVKYVEDEIKSPLVLRTFATSPECKYFLRVLVSEEVKQERKK